MTDSKKATIVVTFLAAFMLCACLLPSLIPSVQKIIDNPSEKTGGDTAGEPRSVTLRQGDYLWFGAYRAEPLLWQVIGTDEGGRPRLLANEAICFKAFDVPGASGDASPDIQAYGSSDWENSTLKRWLNSSADEGEAYGEKGFLFGENFTAEQRESIAQPGVFIPSKAQLKNAAQVMPLKKHCRVSAADENDYLVPPSQTVWYWTQTPNAVSRVSVVCVTSSGGFYKTLANDKNTGVCPAFCFNTKTVSVTGGSGSRSAPYSVAEGGAAK